MLQRWLDTQNLTEREFRDIMATLMVDENVKIVFDEEPAHAPCVRLSWLYDHAAIEIHQKEGVFYYMISNKQPKLIRAENNNTFLFISYFSNGMRINIRNADGVELLSVSVPI